ncbi:MAG: hypothetical protein WCM76_12835 [Bacteroidota bacterium]
MNTLSRKISWLAAGFFAILYYSGCAQPLSSATYNSIPDSLKKEVYFEGFDGNTTVWELNNGPVSAFHAEGTFLALENTDDNSFVMVRSPKISIDASRDFELEFLVVTEGGTGAQEIRFGWGTGEARIEIDLTPALCEYEIIRLTAGIEFIAEPTRNFNAIKRDDFNRITIRRVKDKFYFFANQQLLLECRYRDIPFENFFAGLSGKGLARFDFVRMSYLNIK